MYNTSNYTEDTHINHDGDSALLEAIAELNEARVYAPDYDGDPFPWKNTNTKEEIAERNSRKCDPPERKPKPKPVPTGGTGSKPKPQPKPTPKPSETKEERIERQLNAVSEKIKEGKAIRGAQEDGDIPNFSRKTSRPAKPRDATPTNAGSSSASDKFKAGAKRVGKGALLAAGSAIAKQAVTDTMIHGDPLHTAKEVATTIKKRHDEAKTKHEAEKDRKKIADDFKKWQKEQAKKKKQKLLKEDCVFYVDDSTGAVYYPFSIQEV